jgi:hypothetical protein
MQNYFWIKSQRNQHVLVVENYIFRLKRGNKNEKSIGNVLCEM